jgi:hypothetical protein
LSHSRQRKDKICLNCSAEIYGRYCHVCGQENLEPKETALGLVTHFFYDITHFDGKFFSTVRYLLLKPGFLSKEYLRGRRASYLHPIRMYVFTSAIFFLIFFSFVHTDRIDLSAVRDVRDSIATSANKNMVIALRTAKTAGDSQRIRETFTTEVADTALFDEGKVFPFLNPRYQTKAAYDSAQRRLPAERRDKWVKRNGLYRAIEFNAKMKEDPGFSKTWGNEVLHKFPQLLFISLPIFALLLKLLYRRKKEYNYVDHAVFSIHLYIFTFVTLLIYLLFSRLQMETGWQWINYIKGALNLYIFFYTYKALKNFYQQGWLKTFVKFCLLNMMSFIVILFLFLSFLLLSIYEI